MSVARLSIEIVGDQVRLSDATNMSDGLRALLGAIERDVTGKRRATADWILGTPPELQIEAMPNGVSREELTQITDQAWSELDIAQRTMAAGLPISRAEINPHHRQHIQKLVRALGDGVTAITIIVEERQPIAFVPDESESSDTSQHYESFGTEDGRIEAFSLRPPMYFQLRSHSRGHLVKVYYEPDQEQQIVDARRREVEVTGLIRYRDDGVPISIRNVQGLFIFPDEADLDPLESFAGMIAIQDPWTAERDEN